MNVDSIPPPQGRLVRAIALLARSERIFRQRYTQQERRFMFMVFRALICTSLVCAFAMWVQWKELCRLNLCLAAIFTEIGIMVTHHNLMIGLRAGKELLSLGFVSGFVLEWHARNAYILMGSDTWIVCLKVIFIVLLLMISMMFAPWELRTPVFSERCAWLIYVTMFIHYKNNVISLTLQLGVSLITMLSNTSYLLRRMRAEDTNVVYFALVIYVDLFAVMLGFLKLAALRADYLMK